MKLFARQDPLPCSGAVLRSPFMEDAESLYSGLCSRPDVVRYLTWTPHADADATRERLAQMQEWNRSGTERTWVIATPESMPIGLFTCWQKTFSVELGFCLSPDFWGHGIMSAALGLVVSQLAAEDEVFRIWATCDTDNGASSSVLRKVGLAREGTLRRHALHPNIEATPRDSFLYAMATR